MKFVMRFLLLVVLWIAAVALIPRAMLALDNYNGQFEADTAPSCTVST